MRKELEKEKKFFGGVCWIAVLYMYTPFPLGGSETHGTQNISEVLWLLAFGRRFFLQVKRVFRGKGYD